MKTTSRKAHPQGCRCFACDLDREDWLSEAEEIAEKYNVDLSDIGAGGRAPSPHVGAARRDLAAALHRGNFTTSRIARLMRVDTSTARYWLEKGAES